MKKSLIYSIILIAGMVFVTASIYAQEPEADKPVTEKKQEVKYTCSMHPDVVLDEPGKCPKCGMELVEKKCEKKEAKSEKKDSTKMHDKNMKHDKEGCEKKEE